MMKSTKKNALVLILVSLLLFACDKKEKEVQPKPKPEPPKPVTMLNVVPADTIFFSGGLEPFPLKEVLQWSSDSFNVLKGLDPNSMLPLVEVEDEEIPGRRMAAQLWLDYYAMMLSPEAGLAKWGVEDKPFLTSYTVGLAPVLLRISLKDVQLFNKKIDELEAKAKIASKPETLGKATYRRYALNKSAPSVDLIIGVDNERQHAVFMLDLGVDSEQTLAIALGQQKPEKTLAESGRVEALQKQYKLHPSFIGYIDHQQLITGLTTKEGNSIARMIQKLVPQLEGAADLSEILEELQTEGCRNDLTDIGNNWPKTVFGYTTLDLAAPTTRIDSLMVVENKDKALLDSLQSIRGVVPQYVVNPAEPPILAAGFDFNLEKIVPFLFERWTANTQKQYSCSFMQKMQNDAKKSQQATSLALMSGMAPGMLPGVQGLAFSLMSLEWEKGEASGPPVPKSIDALISVAGKNPTALVQTMSTFFPSLAKLQLPADGTPVQLPLPLPLSFPVMAAINGSHLTVFAGEKSQALAQGLRSETLEESQGLLAADIDYGKFYGLMGDTFTNMDISNTDISAAEQDEIKKISEAIKNVKMRVRINMDVTDRGIEMKADMIATE